MADRPFVVPGIDEFKQSRHEEKKEESEPSPEMHQLSLAGITQEGAQTLLLAALMREPADSGRLLLGLDDLKSALEKIAYGEALTGEDRQALSLAGAIAEDMQSQVSHGNVNQTYRAEELLAQINAFVQAALPYAKIKPIIRS